MGILHPESRLGPPFTTMIGKATIVFVGLVTAVVCQLHVVNDHCKKDCSKGGFDRVCGSDGKTYSNKCEFEVASCLNYERHGRGLHGRKGACPSVVATTPKPNPHCQDLCNEEKFPVCASDGQVYDNKCYFQRAQCEAEKQGLKLFVAANSDTCTPVRYVDCKKYDASLRQLAWETGSTFVQNVPNRRTTSVPLMDIHLQMNVSSAHM